MNEVLLKTIEKKGGEQCQKKNNAPVDWSPMAAAFGRKTPPGS